MGVDLCRLRYAAVEVRKQVPILLIDGDPVGLRDHASVELPDDATVEVLPPFAGG